MTIAIIGWGSLIWKPEGLPYQGDWKLGGPTLPLEFSRITEERPLTVVLDPKDGVLCPTRFAFSSRTRLEDAIADLQQREGAEADQIGYVDLSQNRRSILQFPYQNQINVNEPVWQWCQEHQMAAAVWTEIPPNFEECVGVEFSVGAAIAYLKGLSPQQQESTLEYVYNTPAEVDTPLRRQIMVEWS